MPVSIRKEDLRILKTEKALNLAMFSLLEKRNFGKITVSDICEEALVSRATFYAHFTDKYDFLKDWLVYLKPENVSHDLSFDLMEKTVNQFIYNNSSIIKNIIYQADDETIGILFDFILSNSNFAVEKNVDGKINPEYVVASNFFAGGMFYYFLWQARNRFQSDIAPINVHLYEITKKFQKWDS